MILLTGATGFIGGHVLKVLIERNIHVRCLVRKHIESENPNVNYIIGDVLDHDPLVEATKGVETVYYFIHMMGKQKDQDKFDVLDRNAIINVIKACKDNKVKRIIHLTGMSNPEEKLSTHLSSRREVEEMIKKSGIDYTIFRASIIIGRGGAAFEILDTAVRLLLFIPVLSWYNTKVQPIYIGDVVKYLVGCLDKKETINRCFDIGGPEVFNYKGLMKRYAKEIGIIPIFIWVPGTWHRTSSFILGILSTVNPDVVYWLIESLKNNMVAEPDHLEEIFGFEPISFKESVRKIIEENH